MSRLNEKVCIVTGGAGGIGSAVVRQFVREGAQVVVSDRDEEAVQALASELGEAVRGVVADVTDPDHGTRLVAEATSAFGRLDVVFANAGTEGQVAPLLQQARETFETVYAVNVLGPVALIQAAAPVMAETGGGSIVITSSVAGVIGSAGLAPYICSKHATVGLMRTAAIELAATGIRVNTVNPGPVDNRMMRSIEEMAAPGQAAAVKQGFEAQVPLGRYATNEEIAEMTTFLASDASSYCTGQLFLVDGGFTTG